MILEVLVQSPASPHNESRCILNGCNGFCFLLCARACRIIVDLSSSPTSNVRNSENRRKAIRPPRSVIAESKLLSEKLNLNDGSVRIGLCPGSDGLCKPPMVIDLAVDLFIRFHTNDCPPESLLSQVCLKKAHQS